MIKQYALALVMIALASCGKQVHVVNQESLYKTWKETNYSSFTTWYYAGAHNKGDCFVHRAGVGDQYSDTVYCAEQRPSYFKCNKVFKYDSKDQVKWILLGTEGCYFVRS